LAEKTLSPEECIQAFDSLTVCMSFVTDLTFYSVPDTLAQTVGGAAGFNLLARIFASTAKRIYSQVRARCCPETRSPVPLFQRLERVTKLIGGASYRARALVHEEQNGEIKLEFKGLEHLRDSLLNAAPIVGVIMGMIEAVGGKAVAVTSTERLYHAPDDAYIVHPVRVSGDELDVVVYPPGVRP
jgi:hypothetical protein